MKERREPMVPVLLCRLCSFEADKGSLSDRTLQQDCHALKKHGLLRIGFNRYVPKEEFAKLVEYNSFLLSRLRPTINDPCVAS